MPGSVQESTKVANLYSLPTRPENSAYIGRKMERFDGYFGNPFTLDKFKGDREKVIHLYRNYFYRRIANDPEFKARVLELRGKTLLCFCKPKLCHGDVIAEYLNVLAL